MRLDSGMPKGPVVILAGGKGSRLEEHTKGKLPKPLVSIEGAPILLHIMEVYRSWGHTEFLIAGGHLIEKLEYWVNRYSPGERLSANVIVVDTGEDSQTAQRIFLLREEVEKRTPPEAPFMVTFGDGVGNIDLERLQRTQRRLEATGDVLATITAVHPPTRFGAIQFDNNPELIRSFNEKGVVESSWVNGGFYCISLGMFKAVSGVHAMSSFEFDTLPLLARRGVLGVHRHEGYWQMMDTPRDKRRLEDDLRNGIKQFGKAPWLYYEGEENE